MLIDSIKQRILTTDYFPCSFLNDGSLFLCDRSAVHAPGVGFRNAETFRGLVKDECVVNAGCDVVTEVILVSPVTALLSGDQIWVYQSNSD